MGKPTVRLAKASDLEAIIRLTLDLGYATTPDNVRASLNRVGPSAVFVAEDEGQIVGWAEVSVMVAIEGGPKAVLTGLIVDAVVRRQGIGRALVASCADWTRQQGLPILRVRTNVRRTESVAFYRELGFCEVKQQTVLELEL